MDKVMKKNLYILMTLVFIFLLAFSGAMIAINAFNFVAGYHAYDMAMNILLISYREKIDIYDTCKDCTLGTECIPTNEEYRYGNALMMDAFIKIVCYAFVAGLSLAVSAFSASMASKIDVRPKKSK